MINNSETTNLYKTTHLNDFFNHLPYPCSINVNVSKLHEIGEDRGAWCAAVHGVTVRRALVTEQQQQKLYYQYYSNIILLEMLHTAFNQLIIYVYSVGPMMC